MGKHQRGGGGSSSSSSGGSGGGKERTRPILNSSITYVKSTPKFLQEMQRGVGGPSVEDKFESNVRPEDDAEDKDVVKSDEEPVYEAEEEIIQLMKRQQAERAVETNGEVDEGKLGEKRKLLEGEKVMEEEKEEEEEDFRTKSSISSKKMKKSKGGMEFSSTARKVSISAPTVERAMDRFERSRADEVEVLQAAKKKKRPEKSKEKRKEHLLSFNFDE